MAAPPERNLLPTGDVVTEYRAALQRGVALGSLSATTVDTYDRDLNDFLALTDPHRPLDDLTAGDLDNILLAYAHIPDRRHLTIQRERSPGTIARFYQSISRLFTFAEKNGYLRHNPVPDMAAKPRARRTTTGARTALPLDSARALVTAPDRPARADQNLTARDGVILRVLLEVGPRVSELCRLDRADVEHRDGATWLNIRHGKGGKPRDVPLSRSTASMLAEYVTDHRPAAKTDDADRALFLTYRGNRIGPRDVQNLVARSCRALPADVRRAATPHALRHTMATLALSSGSADVAVVQKLLGHASLATTGVYLDEIREELVKAVALSPVTGDH